MLPYDVYLPLDIAVSEDEVMMPHAFERLWGAFEPQGEFQTHITEPVPQTTVVRHLNDRGFQVLPYLTSSVLRPSDFVPFLRVGACFRTM